MAKDSGKADGARTPDAGILAAFNRKGNDGTAKPDTIRNKKGKIIKIKKPKKKKVKKKRRKTE